MQTAILKSVRFYNWRRSQVIFKRLNERNKLKNLTCLKGFVETIILILIVITYLRVPRVLHCIQFERLILVCSQFMLTGSAELFVLYNMIIYLSTSKIINLETPFVSYSTTNSRLPNDSYRKTLKNE